MAVRGRPGTCLISNKRLFQFHDRDMIEQTREHKFEPLEALLLLYVDLKQYSIKNEYSSDLEEGGGSPTMTSLLGSGLLLFSKT